MSRPVLVATLPPYVPHRAAIIEHPRVDELRFNTVYPLSEPLPDVLARLSRECGGKRLWIDLKGRQLRITRFAFLPFSTVDLNHRLQVNLPTEVHFRDGVGRVEAVLDESRLLLSRRPFRVLGEGEPVNILDPSLHILDPLPERDRQFIEAARAAGLHHYMLSFTESEEDIAAVLALDPDAVILAKIESQRGLQFVRTRPGQTVRLMAARDDLYVHMGADKTAMLEALETIIEADPQAMVASRLLDSLQDQEEVSLADLSDLRLMERLGYRSFLLGDRACFSEDAFHRIMQVIERYWGR